MLGRNLNELYPGLQYDKDYLYGTLWGQLLQENIETTLYVGSAGVYKPDKRVYELVTERYACAPGDIVFVTSNGWDATGAEVFGYKVAWCNRLNNPPETYGPPPSWTIPSLEALPALLGNA